MATSNVKERAAGKRGDEPSLPALSAEAHDLTRLMAQLADRISDADMRHGQGMSSLHKRLDSLSDKTLALRDRLPAASPSASVLERIEGNLADMAGRLSQGPGSGLQRPEAADSAEPAPALRSALAAQALDAYSRRTRPAAPSTAGPVDPFDVVDNSASAHDESIPDEASANALARLYETARADPSGVPPLDAVSATAAEEAFAHGQAAMPLPSPTRPEPAVQAAMAGTSAEDRAWLEQRFADVASRLEQSLASMRSENPLAGIETRFASLERQIAQVATDSPRRADLASLKAIESQVEDLNAQLVTVQTHFSRLDTIELELRSLTDRFSVDELSRLIQQSVPARAERDEAANAATAGVAQQIPRIEQALQSIASQLSADRISTLVAQSRPAAPDANAIARIVAAEVSQKLPAASAGQGDASISVDALKASLEGYMAERRHGDEHTGAMLETLQQAMMRMLDRLDAIESDRHAPPRAQPDESHLYSESYAQHGTAANAPQSLPPYQQPYEDIEPRREHPSSAQPYPSARERAFDQFQHDPEPRPHTPQPQLQPQPAAAVIEARPASPTSASALRASLSQASLGPAAAPELTGSKEDFVASARRAARMAAEAPQTAAPARDEEVNAQVAPEGTKAVRRKLSPVSMALICLILVGASFLVVKSTLLAPPNEPQPVQVAPPKAAPAPAPAPKRIQNLEDADGPSGSQRRSSGGPEGEPTQSAELPSHLAALSQEAPTTIAAPRSNEMPPVAIGPNSLRAAAAKGDPSATYEVGARFAEGRGVPQDLQQGVVWLQRSATQGFAPAQYRLGSMFERGLGVKTDLARARIWYQRAAEQGVIKAMHNLAVLSAGRDSNLTDYNSAGKWFRAAADHGLTDSQFNLAIMHDSGLGMEKDAKQAFKWFSIAARAGDEEAARRRETLRKQLLPKEVVEVETEVASWRPKAADQNLNDPRLAGEAWKTRKP